MTSNHGGTRMKTKAFLVILEDGYDRFDKDAAVSIKRSLELVKGVAEAIDTQLLTATIPQRKQGKRQPTREHGALISAHTGQSGSGSTASASRKAQGSRAG